MNARIETRDTTPTASTAHDALVLDVASRLRSLSEAIAKSIEMHHEDQAALFGQLQDELRAEDNRLVLCRETAYELAGVEL